MSRLERVMGIEPTSSAWKAEVLPLNYTRLTDVASESSAAHCSCRPRIRSPGGGGRIRTYEGVSRQIYSLLPLAAWVPLREKRAAYFDFGGRSCQCRIWANLAFLPAGGLTARPSAPRPSSATVRDADLPAGAPRRNAPASAG